MTLVPLSALDSCILWFSLVILGLYLVDQLLSLLNLLPQLLHPRRVSLLWHPLWSNDSLILLHDCGLMHFLEPIDGVGVDVALLFGSHIHCVSSIHCLVSVLVHYVESFEVPCVSLTSLHAWILLLIVSGWLPVLRCRQVALSLLRRRHRPCLGDGCGLCLVLLDLLGILDIGERRLLLLVEVGVFTHVLIHTRVLVGSALNHSLLLKGWGRQL